MRVRRLLIRLSVAALLLCAAGAAGLWWLGGTLVAPRPAVVGPPPADLHAREVSIAVPQAPPVAGWWIAGEPGRASVLLLHGIRSDRRAMLGRARLLSQHGYAVLLVDLPAHGESPGDAITLGWREAAAVTAARDWMQQQRPGEKRAVIGVSLGGALVLLGPQPSGFDAVVLEAVYSDARQAIRNRIAMRLGDTAARLSPVLAMQAEIRLGIPVDQLSPITRIAGLGAPVLLVAGGRDTHTLPAESRAMYERANAPKSFWLLPDAAHVDFQAHDPEGYADRVIGFLTRQLDDPAR
ncbi:MAG: alpha/beta hydrolase [Xanthomonas sp.]|nr:alpha/beta hydrolase [Xanthomonas sp.]